MKNDLTLIETEVLEELLEKAILYDIINEQIIRRDDPDTNLTVSIRKHNFLSKYISVDMNFNETIIDALEKKGYE